MKKLYLGLVLMLTGAIIIAGALISGGAVMGGLNADSGRFYDIFDSQQASLFIAIGMFLLIIGMLISVKEAYKKEIQ
jgi:uncharacterized membrane protein